MANYLFAKPYKYFRTKRAIKRNKAKKLRLQRQEDFRKGFVPKGRRPNYMKQNNAVQPELPKYGSNKRLTLRRKIKSAF